MERISSLEAEIAELRKTLHAKEQELNEIKKEWAPYLHAQNGNGPNQSVATQSNESDRTLPKWAIERYSRQILLPEIGVPGQQKLCRAKVLIVGAGGLGCPAALYLAGAGVGEIGVVDYDTVDLTNLHRQTLHGEGDQGTNKVHSAAHSLRDINSRITIVPYHTQLDSSNALQIASKYDVVLDCTDNVPTRYMLNDVCVIAKKPLVSGSALKMEGQITIYAYRGSDADDKESRGPCYRCLFPSPPPAETVGSCSAHGVLGPVTGAIGALQALEAIKYIVGHPREKLLVGRMLLLDGDDISFRTVKLRGPNPSCAACSQTATITQLVDYEAFCQAQAKEKKRQEARLKSQRRIEEKRRRMTGQSYLGFRVQQTDSDSCKRWIQDVPKSERTIGPRCNSDVCGSRKLKSCSQIDENERKCIFSYFWKLNWAGKKEFVRSLVDIVPPKRRRLKHKAETSRKGDSKLYHLKINDEKTPVCRVMFLNTLGIKEAMVRSWLVKDETPRNTKKPIKTLNVDRYLDAINTFAPKCKTCQNSDVRYIDTNSVDNVKNLFQFYNYYVTQMKSRNISHASRKTFSKVFAKKRLRFFKPANDSDVCDIDIQHNTTTVASCPSEGTDGNEFEFLPICPTDYISGTGGNMFLLNL